MKEAVLKNKKIMLAIVLSVFILSLAVTGYLILETINKPVNLNLGVFSGSIYNVPNWQSYKIVDEAIEEFQSLNPDMKVKYRSGTLKSDYSEWLAQKVLTGEEPDVFCVLPGDFNTFASLGILKNLDPLIAKDQDFQIAKIYLNGIRSGQFLGSQFALPRELEPVLMFVNTTLLKREGIELPRNDWTWNDLYNICLKVTRDRDGDGKIDQYGITGFSWQHAVYTNGQRLFDANGQEARFDQPGVLEAVKFEMELNKLNQNFKALPDDFDRGIVAFRPFPFSWYRAYKSYPYRVIRYAQFDWECIKLPRGPHGNNASELFSFLIGISSRTRHENEAWRFLKFLTYNNTSQKNVFRYSHGVPVLREITESSEADEELSRYNPEERVTVDTKVLGEVIEQSIVTPRFHKYEDVMNMADKEIYQIINGEKNAEDTLAKLNRELNALLGKQSGQRSAGEKARKSYRFGVTYMTMNNPFFIALNEGLRKAVEDKGDKLVALDPALDLKKQIAGVKDLIAQKVNLIFLNPVDWKGIKPALEAASEAGIPVIVVDAPVFDEELVLSTVSSDNWGAGVLCAEDMKKRISEGNVVILEHPSVKTSIDRTRSFEETIKNSPRYKIVAKQSSNGQLEQAMPVMENIIRFNKRIDVVMALNDPTAMGAIAALEAAGRMNGKILVYGVDGSPDAKKMVKEGKITATAAQSPKTIGKMAAEAAYKYLEGEKIERNIRVPVELIDRESVEKFGIDSWQ